MLIFTCAEKPTMRVIDLFLNLNLLKLFFLNLSPFDAKYLFFIKNKSNVLKISWFNPYWVLASPRKKWEWPVRLWNDRATILIHLMFSSSHIILGRNRYRTWRTWQGNQDIIIIIISIIVITIIAILSRGSFQQQENYYHHFNCQSTYVFLVVFFSTVPYP